MLKLGRFIVWDALDGYRTSIATQLKERGCDVTVVRDQKTLTEELQAKKYTDAIIIRGDWPLFVGKAGHALRLELLAVAKPAACLLVALCDEISAKEQDDLINMGFDDVVHEPIYIGQLISRLSGLSRLALMKRELNNRLITMHKFMIIADPEDNQLNFVHDNLKDKCIEPSVLLLDIDVNKHYQSTIYNQLRNFSDVHYCNTVQSAHAYLFTRDVDISIVLASENPDVALAFVAELRNSSRLYNHPVILQLDAENNYDLDRAFNSGLNDVIFGDPCIDELESRIRALLRHEILRRQLSEECHSVNESFVRDGLTGVYSHGFGLDHLCLLIKEMSFANRALSVGQCSFVNLNTINERFGYIAGDAILRQTAQIISRCVRGEDMVARLSGSKFLIAFPESDRSQSDYAMTRLKSILHHTMFTMPGCSDTVPVNIEQSLVQWSAGTNVNMILSKLMNIKAVAA